MLAFEFYMQRARSAAARAAELERALSVDPSNAALRINLRSAQRLFERAEAEFRDIATKEEKDIVRYRLVCASSDEYLLPDLSNSWSSFQQLFSTIFDAFSDGPKERARISAKRRIETSFGFAYSFSGSLGVVLTVPSAKNLFFGKFEQTVQAINEIFSIDDPDEVRDMARKIGRASVQKIFEWSRANSRAGFDLDLSWEPIGGRAFGQYIEQEKFTQIAEIIDATSDEESIAITEVGVLVGINTTRKTFHFVVPDGASYVGHLSPLFPSDKEWSVNKRYSAEISVKKTVKLATGQEVEAFSLVKLLDEPDFL